MYEVGYRSQLTTCWLDIVMKGMDGFGRMTRDDKIYGSGQESQSQAAAAVLRPASESFRRNGATGKAVGGSVSDTAWSDHTTRKKLRINCVDPNGVEYGKGSG